MNRFKEILPPHTEKKETHPELIALGIMLLGIAGDEDDPYSKKVTKETKKFLNNQNAMFIPSRVQFMAQPPVYSYWRTKLKPSGRKKDKEPQREVEYRVR